MTAALLCAQDLVYGRHHVALYGPLSFACEPGQTTAILGRNGCGKTTLLLTLAGVLPVLAGAVSRNAELAWVPQNFHTELQFRVGDIVLMGRARSVGLFALPRAADEAAARAALAQLGAENLWEHVFADLSGGQQQLVMIARALASRAQTLLLDEPMAALDLGRQQEVLRLIMGLRTQGKSVVFSTHDPLHAALVADRVLLLLTEKRFLYGPCEEVLTPENLAQAYGVDIASVDLPSRQRKIPVPDFSL